MSKAVRAVQRRLGRGDIVWIAALVLVGAATAYAGLPAGSIGTSALHDRAVTHRKLGLDAVLGSNISANTVTGKDINEASLGTVPSALNANTLGGRDDDAYVLASSDTSIWYPVSTAYSPSGDVAVTPGPEGVVNFSTTANNSQRGLFIGFPTPETLMGKALYIKSLRYCYATTGSMTIKVASLGVLHTTDGDTGATGSDEAASEVVDRTAATQQCTDVAATAAPFWPAAGVANLHLFFTATSANDVGRLFAIRVTYSTSSS